MSDYIAHQNLIQRFKLLCIQEIKGLDIFDRHIGLFYTKRGNPIKIGMNGQADLYGIYATNNWPLHFEFEAKTGNAKQSKDQKNWQKYCESKKIPYILFYSEFEGVEKTLQYLKSKSII